MLDFHHRVKALRNVALRNLNVPEPYWNNVVGGVERHAWWPATRAISPRGINVTILEHVNAP